MSLQPFFFKFNSTYMHPCHNNYYQTLSPSISPQLRLQLSNNLSKLQKQARMYTAQHTEVATFVRWQKFQNDASVDRDHNTENLSWNWTIIQWPIVNDGLLWIFRHLVWFFFSRARSIRQFFTSQKEDFLKRLRVKDFFSHLSLFISLETFFTILLFRNKTRSHLEDANIERVRTQKRFIAIRPSGVISSE